MNTKIKVLKEIYVNGGMHARALCRKLNLGMPSVKYALDQIRYLLQAEKEGRNITYKLNYKIRDLIPFLYFIEYSRIKELPKKIQYAAFDYLNILSSKPIISLIFGSYAEGSYRRDSDLDLLLVFNKKTREAEEKAKVISLRYNVGISPVYLDYQLFKGEFHNQRKKFFQDLKRKKILLTGIEWWVELKNEET